MLRLSLERVSADADVGAFLEAAWPLLDHTVRLVARGKIARTVTDEHLADARAEALSRASHSKDELVFQTPNPAGMLGATHRILEHWLVLATLAIGERLDPLLATHGLRRVDWPALDDVLVRSPHERIVAMGPALCVLEREGGVVADCGSLPDATPAQRKALSRAMREEQCRCPMCEGLRKARPDVDVAAFLRTNAAAAHAESLRGALARPAAVRELWLAGRRDLDPAQLERIGELTALTSLNVSRTRVSALPDSIRRLRALTSLDVSDTPMQALNEAIGDTALERLVANESRLRALPDALRRVPLRTLRLGFRGTPPPDGFLPVLGELHELRTLEIHCGTTHTLAHADDDTHRALAESASSSDAWARALEAFDFAAAMPALEVLHLSNFPLTRLPGSLSRSTALRHLDVRGAPIERLDVDLRSLPLRHLQLEGRIEQLPEWLGEISTLDHLAFHGSFTEIPASLFALTQLEGLGLGGDYPTLPDRFAAFTRLKHVWLTSRSLTSLPPSLASLPSLELLALRVPNASELLTGVTLPTSVRVST